MPVTLLTLRRRLKRHGYQPYSVTLGDGANDTVNAQVNGGGLNITVGNGNHDVVNAESGPGDSITVGNGNDVIYAGLNNTITVGTGHDSFVFEYGSGSTGTTITGFDPHKDSFTFSTQITTAVSYQDDAHGNAVITVDNAAIRSRSWASTRLSYIRTTFISQIRLRWSRSNWRSTTLTSLCRKQSHRELPGARRVLRDVHSA